MLRLWGDLGLFVMIMCMKIASLSPAITEILFALELQDFIVCTDQYSDYPEDVKDIPHVQCDTSVDIRDLYDHDVTVLFTLSVHQEGIAKQLTGREFGVSHHDPKTINDIYEMIRSIGMMMQVEPKSEAVVLAMQQGFKDIKRKSSLLSRRQKVYIEGCPEPWVMEVAHIAGLELTADATNADILVSKSGRIIDADFLKRPGPRLIEGARYLYGWAFENLH